MLGVKVIILTSSIVLSFSEILLTVAASSVGLTLSFQKPRKCCSQLMQKQTLPPKKDLPPPSPLSHINSTRSCFLSKKIYYSGFKDLSFDYSDTFFGLKKNDSKIKLLKSYTFQKEESLQVQIPSQIQQLQLQLQSTISILKYGISNHMTTGNNQERHNMYVR